MFRTKSNIYDGTNFTSNIYDGADFTSVKPYFKNVINSIKLPLGCIFYTTLSFAKKPYKCENFWRKSLLLRIEQFFRNLKLRNGMPSSVKKVF